MRYKKLFLPLILMIILIAGFGFSSKIASAGTTESDRKYLRVNSVTQEFKEIIYVDNSNGDDINGDGSKGNPFKTVVKGFDYLNGNCREVVL